jgi:divalent metal cation (Fe/Co/Zn/Cd) transporter
MDVALEPTERALVDKVLSKYRAESAIDFHAVMTRQAGAHKFVSLHVLVPGEWSVQRGHEMLECIEQDIRTAIPKCNVFTHLEPHEDPVSFQDQRLERD